MSGFQPLPPLQPASNLALPSQRELQNLHAQLLNEEHSLQALKPQVPNAPLQAQPWRYLPQTGAPMQILVTPSLDGPKSHQVLHPGEIFHVVDTATDQAGSTYLKLQDGRGWALQSKPGESAWLSFFGGAEKTELCFPFIASRAPDQGAGQFTRPSILSAALPPQPPTVPQTQLHMAMAVPQSQIVGHGSADMVGLLGRTASSAGMAAHKAASSPSSHRQLAASSPERVAPGSAEQLPQLHVRVLSARGLRNMDVGSFFGNKSDPYVVVRVGKEQRQTPVIDNNLDPVWTEGRDFTFALGDDAPNSIELEVFNSNLFVDDTLGKTSLSLNVVPRGQWVRKADQLRGSSAVAPAEGELEYEVLLEGSKAQPSVRAC